MSHFAFLDGRIFKDQLLEILSREPELEGCLVNKPALKATAKKNFSNSLQLASEYANPLQKIIDGTRVSYTHGGIFSLRRILRKMNPCQCCWRYLDIDLMVNKLSQDDYDKLVEF